MPRLYKRKRPICIHEGCETMASFNYIGLTTRLYCNIHKLDGMINLTIVRCIICNNPASYNYIGKIGKLYCKIHKSPDMIDLNKRKDKITIKTKKKKNNKIHTSNDLEPLFHILEEI